MFLLMSNRVHGETTIGERWNNDWSVFRTLNDTFLTRVVYIGNIHNFLRSM